MTFIISDQTTLRAGIVTFLPNITCFKAAWWYLNFTLISEKVHRWLRRTATCIITHTSTWTLPLIILIILINLWSISTISTISSVHDSMKWIILNWSSCRCISRSRWIKNGRYGMFTWSQIDWLLNLSQINPWQLNWFMRSHLWFFTLIILRAFLLIKLFLISLLPVII